MVLLLLNPLVVKADEGSEGHFPDKKLGQR